MKSFWYGIPKKRIINEGTGVNYCTKTLGCRRSVKPYAL